MNLQARLTLYFVLLAMVLVGVIAAVNLAQDMQLQFDSTLERAESLRVFATDMLKDTVARQPDKSLREALRDPDLTRLLQDTMLASSAILEIAVVDPEGEVLADSNPDHPLGEKLQHYDDFRPVVTKSTWYQKLRVLNNKRYYQLESALGRPGPGGEPGPAILYIRVVIAPTFMRDKIIPRLTRNAWVALAAILGAVCITFLVSTVAFRPLSRLRQQLEQVASGEYQPGPEGLPAGVAGEAPAKKPATDELSIMATKVSILGERLRGAQFEVSDLRGNIDHLLQDLEDAVFIFNRDRRLIFASGSVEKFLGRQRVDLMGGSISEIFPPSTTLGLLIAQSSQTGRAVRNRRVPVTTGETAVPIVLLSTDFLETLPGSSGTGSGILVRLRDPEAQRKIGRELQTADRMAAISRVSGGVAHEVKNPLNAILLHVEVARAKLSRGDTEISQQMEIISREILRLDRVVKTFLDFTRPVELKLGTVAFGELLEEIVELARPQAAARQINIVVDERADGAEIRVDRDLLKQAVLNVVVNAIEAMPEGGELRFESTAGEDLVEIRVSDTGPGIPSELRDKIFRLYFTTKDQGSGIGLAMTFRIVQLHDGTIDFTSEPGKGTTFSIRLPLAV
ncbi:MAG TPA: ATP-binding protein [Bryobacteraceae bacterium]|nr:ATP-binding protein [Bryobacteraceae bacterium]